MEIFKKLAYVLTALVLTQCATTSPPASTPSGGVSSRVGTESTASTTSSTLSDGCPLDKMQWLASSQNFDASKQKDLAKKIAQAAKADAATLDKLLAGSQNPLDISSSLKSYIEGAAKTKTPVSEEFYKQYTNSRMTMCAVLDALRNGSIKQEDRSKVAGNTFRDVAQSFEKLTN